jgi:PadR family transcriptional regulator, regulatory protein PadR
MTKPETYRNRIELLQGTLDMLILQALQREPMHGYAIAQSIRMKSSEVLQVETGSLYPALHRLERQRWVKPEWKLTESRQRAKFYQITSKGREQLAADHARWQAMVRAIAAVMGPGVEPVGENG